MSHRNRIEKRGSTVSQTLHSTSRPVEERDYMPFFTFSFSNKMPFSTSSSITLNSII